MLQHPNALPKRPCHVYPLSACPQVCRCLPWVVRNYHLEELTSVHQLRRNVASMFRKYSDVSSPEVVDLLVYKGREELEVRRRRPAPASRRLRAGQR